MATLEELLASGQVRSALILKGDFTDAERDLIQRAYEAGIQVGGREREQLVAALRVARLHLRPEIGGRFDQKAAVAVIDKALREAGEPRD